MTTACEERGPDLAMAARPGTSPPGDLRAHLETCAACAGELRFLRNVLEELAEEDRDLAPSPDARARFLRDLARDGGGEAVPLPRPRTRSGAARLAPVLLLAGSLAAGLFLAVRGGTSPEVGEPSGVPPHAVAAGVLYGSLTPETAGWRCLLPSGSELEARERTVVRFQSPVDCELALDAGARVRVDVPHRSFLLLSGRAWFSHPAEGPETGAPPGIRVETGDLRWTGSGELSVHRNGDLVTAHAGAGAWILKRGTESVNLVAPSRIDIRPDGPMIPAPAEPLDASAWFLRPEVSLGAITGESGQTEWEVVMRPSLPRILPVAPWEGVQTPFSLRVTAADGSLRVLPVERVHLARPAPEEMKDGAFLLGPDRPYILRVNPAALRLEPGTFRIEAVYTATRPGGLWRGVAASPPMTVERK